MKQQTVRSLYALSAITLVVGAGVSSGSAASRSLIAIHEQGENLQLDQTVGHCPCGRFTLDLRGTRFGPTGTTRIFVDLSATRYVNGQERQTIFGTENLTSKQGHIVLSFEGIHVPLNGTLTPSGVVVGPAAEYGTWRVKTATGIYRGWRGGGNWASVRYGYGKIQPYSVEWDGYVSP